MPPTFGDPEAAVVDILNDSPAVAAFSPEGIASDLIGYASPARWLVVTRTGGAPTLWRMLDNPRIQVAARAEDKGAALDLAAAARDAVYAARGYIGHGLSLYDVAEDEGLAWSPDERDPTIPRYTFTLALVTKPAP